MIVRPFENHLVEIIKALPENKVVESAECVAVMSRWSRWVRESRSADGSSCNILFQSNHYSTASHCARIIRALCTFGRLSDTLQRFLLGASAVFSRLVHTSASVVCVAFDGNQLGDERNLAQYIHLVWLFLRFSSFWSQIW
ncbi:unnamed protein product [Gongylonema pulchrum]|uniref:Uncharacterized protein n=1 Tax=Gongylonema pulchrum TaxID=637853 RepID=A0A3P7N457_9BILA|nr:unnamed protein product [Gongylonema pulchrum]